MSSLVMLGISGSRVFQRISSAIGITVATVGVMVTVGWLLEIEQLKNILPNLATMKFNTALCFVLSGLSLCAYQAPRANRHVRRGARLCVCLVLVIGLMTFLEYEMGRNFGIDQLIVRDRGTPDAEWPGRMSVATALNFSLIAIALLLLDAGFNYSAWLSQFVAIVTSLIGGVALLGYIYGVQIFIFPVFTTMAVHTALLFFLLGWGVLLARPTNGPIIEFSQDRIGGRLARYAIPAVVIVPAVLGWLCLTGYLMESYSAEFGFALNSLSNTVILAILVWVSARSMNQMQQRIDAANKQQNFLASIVESSDDAIISKNLDGNITSWNPGAEHLYGYTADEIINKPMSQLVPPDHLDEEWQILNSIRRGERTKHIESVRRHKDGRLIETSVTVSPIVDQYGTVIGASHVDRDITERKRAEQNLQRKTDELLRSNQDLEQFAYVASHDLQEPLRAVSGCVQLLRQGYANQLDERAKEYMTHAVEGATRMQTLIEGLLLYSRVGRSNIAFQQVDSEKAFELAIKNLEVMIDEAKAEITCDALPAVSGISSQINLLFQNLLANAIKFRQKNEPVIIHVAAKHLNNEWVFSVRDNGMGIEPQYFERIFVIFQRLHTRREYPGTGIGLALCKRIVEHHGGRIWLESEPGHGTTFYFTLADNGLPQVINSEEG